MKTINYVLLFVTAIFMDSCNLSSDEASLTSTDNALAGTQWKLGGFVDVQTGKLTEAEPKDCISCYIIVFETDSSGVAQSVANEIQVQLKKPFFPGGTKVYDNEIGNVSLFYEAIQTVDSFQLDDNKLKFFYDQGKKYLLYESLNVESTNPLQGEWSWVKTYAGSHGNLTNPEYKSVIKIGEKGKDASYNYGIFVADTLFSTGTFTYESGKWNNIQLPHPCYSTEANWLVRFEDTEGKKSAAIFYFYSGNPDDYFYYYQKLK